MRVIDCHTHCFPDAVAEKAVASLTSAYQLTPSFDGTIKGLLGQMDAAGIEASIILPVATKPSQVQSINDWVRDVQNERLIGFGAMHPDFPRPHEEIMRMEQVGIRGIKLHPNWQGFRPDDERMMPVYEAAEGRLVIYCHAGEEIDVWPEILATPEAIGNVHRSFPGLKLVAAHMGGYRMWEQVEEHLLGTGVYFDMSYCYPKDLPDDRFMAILRAHGADKILFGSDSPCGHPVPQLERLLSLPLTDEEKELIAWKNAARLLSL